MPTRALGVSISRLFGRLGAPLANNRWSWAAQRVSDGAVFLRVWQDLKFIDDARSWFMVLESYSDGDAKNLRAEERVRHAVSIRNGALVSW